ncbi:MAG: archease [Burkholderiales bacterium]
MSDTGARWEHFRHGADIGVRGFGPTLAEAFRQAALALTAVMTEPETVESEQTVQIECNNSDPEYLLVDWLNALVYEIATRRMLFGRFDVRIDGDRLAATAWGEAVDVSRHRPAVEIKGATLTELRVAHEPSGEWVAQCVVDV